MSPLALTDIRPVDHHNYDFKRFVLLLSHQPILVYRRVNNSGISQHFCHKCAFQKIVFRMSPESVDFMTYVSTRFHMYFS